MKPQKVFLFIGITLALALASLYFQHQLNWNIFSYFQADAPVDSINNPLEQTYTTISDVQEETSTKTVCLQSFPYDSINGNIRTLNPEKLTELGQRFKQAHTSGKTARIFYLGDSQLEGDFQVASIRKTLQEKYGGKGPGLIALGEYYSNLHKISVNTSKNWKQSERMHIEPGNKSLLFRHATLNNEKAWLKISRIQSFQAQEDYQQLRLFFVSKDSTHITISDNNQVISDYQLSGSDEMRVIRLEFEHTPQNIKIDIDTKGEFEAECISLDKQSGIYVDNIPLRGKATPLFNISDSIAIQGMFNILKPDLFILQFGANIIKYANKKNINIFRKKTIEQIKLIKRWSPNAHILLVSISDIAHKTPEGIVSYQNITTLKSVQYEIAMQNDCSFWDLDYYIEQNGGIVSWTNTNPALARQDYLHFTKYGAENIGLSLSKLLLNEFEK